MRSGAIDRCSPERTKNMPKIWRVYSGQDGRSHIAEVPMAMKEHRKDKGAWATERPLSDAVRGDAIPLAIAGPSAPVRPTDTMPLVQRG
jgi:hypothetical protein